MSFRQGVILQGGPIRSPPRFELASFNRYLEGNVRSFSRRGFMGGIVNLVCNIFRGVGISSPGASISSPLVGAGVWGCHCGGDVTFSGAFA